MSTAYEGESGNNRDFVDMDVINRLHVRFKGMATRTMAPDRLYPLPPIGRLDRYSRCFVTQASHVIKKRFSRCAACEHWLTEY